MTPTQEAALNKAIAEFEGYKRQDPDSKRIWYACPLDYTRSLDAIMPVVQRWCEKENATLHINYWLPEKHFTVGIGWQNSNRGVAKSSKQPALALCLTFAQAAGLKGDWNE